MTKVTQDKELPEGTKVFFDIQEVKGTGIVCGISAALPRTTIYIVRANVPFDPSVYPYSCFTVPSGCLMTLTEDEDKETSREMAGWAAGHPLTDDEWAKWCQFCVDDPDGSKTAKGACP